MSYLELQRTNVDKKIVIRDELSSKSGLFIWRVKFSEPLDPKSVNNINMYVTTVNNEQIKTSIRYNDIENIIEIRPIKEYNPNESYYLNITRNVRSESGKHLDKEVKLQFKMRKAD